MKVAYGRFSSAWKDLEIDTIGLFNNFNLFNIGPAFQFALQVN